MALTGDILQQKFKPNVEPHNQSVVTYWHILPSTCQYWKELCNIAKEYAPSNQNGQYTSGIMQEDLVLLLSPLSPRIICWSWSSKYPCPWTRSVSSAKSWYRSGECEHRAGIIRHWRFWCYVIKFWLVDVDLIRINRNGNLASPAPAHPEVHAPTPCHQHYLAQ